MANQSPVPLTSGLPETVLPPAPRDAREALASALASAAPSALASSAERTGAVAAVAAVASAYPRFLDAWAELAELAAAEGHHVESYAYARVGYHRGLDALRAAGWRGSGYVRWTHATNRGFLRALAALRLAALAIGESDEQERCEVFLRQLDPEWVASAVTP